MNDNFLEIISAKSGECRDLFLAAATRLGTTEQNVEKDFWVCWAEQLLSIVIPNSVSPISDLLRSSIAPCLR
jgi:hypothetical protein